MITNQNRGIQTLLLSLLVLTACTLIYMAAFAKPYSNCAPTSRTVLHTMDQQSSMRDEAGVSAKVQVGGGVNSSVAMFALIARNSANVLPYSLNNIKRLAQRFARSHVLMIENDSEDDTVKVFKVWLEDMTQKYPTITGEARTNTWQAPRDRDLSVFARARNEYLQALRELQYSDVDILIVVDTDMCMPWDAGRMEQVINALMFPPPQQKKTQHKRAAMDAIYAYGSCGWYSKPEKHAPPTAPYTPGAFARYCDMFALQDNLGRRYVIKRGGAYPRLVSSTWREQVVPLSGNAAHAANTTCMSADMQAQGCAIENGEAVIPVRSAFGGMGVYRASMFRLDTLQWADNGTIYSSVDNNTSELCKYNSDADKNECEHVTLSNCLHDRGYKQGVALHLVVGWEKEACSGPVVDSLPDPASMLGWGGFNCPCADF